MTKNNIKVFKFGGASVKNAQGIRNVTSTVAQSGKGGLVIVVSAMGKTTNALERIVELHFKKASYQKELSEIKKYHQDVIDQLGFPADATVRVQVDEQFSNLVTVLHQAGEFDAVYDQVVSLGEVISSLIVAAYINQTVPVEWVDSRRVISTDAHYREATVNWEKTAVNIQQLVPTLQAKTILTQGFIGSNDKGKTTTLGRDGSDFTAGIYGYCLDAESVTIWKDVPGVMNADPKRLTAAVVFDELPFKEAAEMTYYGASVIHPKTIKPLANKGIPLLVKSFENPSLPGTKIRECKVDKLPPLIVFKDNQCLITCKVTDYTFVDEDHLSRIFNALAESHIKINLMQNSAITFSFCVDYREANVKKLMERLSNTFEVYYNTGLTLITVKNYDAETFREYRAKPGLMLEQSSRSTLQVLIRAAN